MKVNGDIDDIDDSYTSIQTYVQDSKRQRGIPRELPPKVSSASATTNEPEFIGILLSVYQHLINASHRIRRESGTGEWNAERKDVTVTKPANVITKTFGETVEGVVRVNAEEFVHLHERGVMAVEDGGRALQTGAVWRLAVGSANLLVGVYTAYAYLRRLGYTVVRHVPVSSGQRLPGNVSQQQPVSASKKMEFRELILKIRQRAPSHWNCMVDPPSVSRSLPLYDVFKPSSQYKRSERGVPSYVMAVCGADQPSLAPAELCRLTGLDYEVASLVAVTEPGSTAFLCVQTAETPSVNI